MTDKNPIEQAEELAGMPLNMHIKDGVFIIEPSDAGIALLASLRAQQQDTETAWQSVDEMTEELEKARAENAVFRMLLSDTSEIMRNMGMDREANRIDRALWKVVGIDDEGNEVEFDYFENEEDND